MSQKGPQHPAQLLREIVMITTFTLAIVMVSYGLHGNDAFKISQMQTNIDSLLPPIHEPALLHAPVALSTASAKPGTVLH